MQSGTVVVGLAKLDRDDERFILHERHRKARLYCVLGLLLPEPIGANDLRRQQARIGGDLDFALAAQSGLHPRSGMTPFQKGCTMSRLMPRRITEFCLLPETAGDVGANLDAIRFSP